jgi:hypothetical protein
MDYSLKHKLGNLLEQGYYVREQAIGRFCIGMGNELGNCDPGIPS